MKVDLFIPCFIDQFYPKVGFAAVNVLQHFGCEINYNPKQTCCGQPSYNSGFFDETKRVAEFFYQNFSGENLIVSPSGSCVSMVKLHYNDLIDKDKFINLSGRIFEITDFLYSVLKADLSKFDCYKSFLLHRACHTMRELKTLDSTISLLRQIKGLELKDFKDQDECCGFGGTFSYKFDNISIDMGTDKVTNYHSTGIDTVISTDSSCLMHQESIAKKIYPDLKFLHVIELIDMIIGNRI